MSHPTASTASRPSPFINVFFRCGPRSRLRARDSRFIGINAFLRSGSDSRLQTRDSEPTPDSPESMFTPDPVPTQDSKLETRDSEPTPVSGLSPTPDASV